MANSDNLSPVPTQPNNVATVVVSPKTSTVALSGTVQLTATAKDKSGATINGMTFLWESRNPSIATVSASGLVTAYAGRQPATHHKQDGTNLLVGGIAYIYVTVKRADGSIDGAFDYAIITVQGN